MPGKQRYLRSIDIPLKGGFAPGAGADSASSPAIAPPPQSAINAPSNLQLTTAIERNAVTPTAQISATWYPPAGVAPSGYIVQWSVDSAFPATTTNGQPAPTESTTIQGLIPNTVYYVRVAALAGNQTSAWSDTASITTAADTVAPSPVTGQSASFQGIGDLVVLWTNPTSANFRDVEVVIKASSGGATLATLYKATSPLVWTVAENLNATSQAGDPSVYVELRVRSWGGIFSTSVNTGTVTKAVPATPTGLTSSWAGDTGAAGPDCAISWTAQTDAAYYILTIGSVARTVFAPKFTYTLDTNRSDNGGTADPSLVMTVVAVDGLKQSSTGAGLNATNAAPAAPTVAINLGQNEMVCRVTSAAAADFLAYEYVWKKDGATIITHETASALHAYVAQAGDEGSHSWNCTVRQRDVFGQYSTATVSSTVVMDALTIAYLRAGLVFSDSVGNTVAALSVLKDGDMDAPGISYAA